MTIGDKDCISPVHYLPIMVIGCGLVLLITFRLGESPFGRGMKGIREDERAVRALGKHTSGAKLLDEPSLGFSSAIVLGIFQVIRDFAQQDTVSVLLVAQNVRAALRIPESAYFMRAGEIILEEPADVALARGVSRPCSDA